MARARKTPIKTAPLAEAAVVTQELVAPEAVLVQIEPVAEVAAVSASALESAPTAPAAEESVRKPKLVRDSFTMPKGEYQRIDALKARGATLGRPVKKSELLRAGIKLLDALPDAELMQALGDLASIKTGRPGKASR